jgi:hypothetical protein
MNRYIIEGDDGRTPLHQATQSCPPEGTDDFEEAEAKL